MTGFSLSLPLVVASVEVWGWSGTVGPLLSGAGWCGQVWCDEVGLGLAGAGARGAEPPVGHLGLVQDEAGGVHVELGRVEARCRTSGAVDVDDVAAAAAHHVVVVVAHP